MMLLLIESAFNYALVEKLVRWGPAGFDERLIRNVYV